MSIGSNTSGAGPDRTNPRLGRSVLVRKPEVLSSLGIEVNPLRVPDLVLLGALVKGSEVVPRPEPRRSANHWSACVFAEA